MDGRRGAVNAPHTVLYVADNPSNLQLIEQLLAAGARAYRTKPLGLDTTLQAPAAL